MDPHGRMNQNGGGGYFGGGYGYDQGGGATQPPAPATRGSGGVRGTGASEPPVPMSVRNQQIAPNRPQEGGTGVGLPSAGGGGGDLPGGASALTPAEQSATSPGSLKDQLRKNLKPTIAYCSVFWMFGMSVAFLGPTLLDLGCQTASDMQQISWVFFAQLLCSLIGSTLAGFLSKRAEPNMILLVASTLIPLCMFIIPFCEVLGALGLVLAVMGFNMGCIDCLANLKMIQLYGEAVAPFLQGMHFCYGFGAFVSPMIAEPFLLNEDCTPFIDNVTDTSAASMSIWYENGTLPANTLEEAQEKTRVRFAFWIMAAVNLPIPILLIHLLMRKQFTSAMPILARGAPETPESQVQPARAATAQTRVDAPGKNKSDYENIDTQKAKFMASTKPFWQQDSQYQHHRSGKWFGTHSAQVIIITCLTASTVFIYDGLQSAYGGYVYTYAVKSIVDLNKTEGAYLNAVFWGTFALGRLMSIICATRFTPQFMLLCNICGCLLSMVLMLTLQHNHVALYFGTCFFGLFMSSVTPTALSLAEQYIDVTSSITTFIVVIAALGEMLFPVIVGNLFVSVGPSSFLGFGNIACFASVFVFAGIWFFGRQTPKYNNQPSSGFIWCHMCCWRRPGGGAMPGDEDGLVTTHVKYYSRMSESDSNIELSQQTGSNQQMAPQKMDGYGY